MKKTTTATVNKNTLKNWERLGHTGALESRANKRLSKKLSVAEGCLLVKDNRRYLRSFAPLLKGRSLFSFLYSAALKKLSQNNVPAVYMERFKSEYKRLRFYPEVFALEQPQDEPDFIGFLYQSLLAEGERNKKGVYYTPPGICAEMTEDLLPGEAAFDPCCGSGVILIAAAKKGCRVSGSDNDPIAVMLAKANLLSVIPSEYPEIALADFRSVSAPANALTVTNPPWGAGEEKESFQLFLSHSIKAGAERLAVMLPEAFFSVGKHEALRKSVLEYYAIDKINERKGGFSGVLTGFSEVFMHRKAENEKPYTIFGSEEPIPQSDFYKNPKTAIEFISSADRALIDRIFSVPHGTLEGSTFGMGIVTGKNGSVLHRSPAPGREPILMGKDISPCGIEKPEYYIDTGGRFQQSADISLYRKNKLVYRFISEYPVAAADTEGRLLLNSANFIIPDISPKTLAVLLNSSLYRWLYKKLCGGRKVLKSGLMLLPIPENLPPCGLDGYYGKDADAEIFRLFGLSGEDIRRIRS